jgi:DNA polymerase-3 subunit gamma/tau
MAALLQQMAVQQAIPGALDENDTEAADAIRLAALMPADETQLLYSMAIHGRAELSLVSDDYAALTMVLLRLFAFPSAGTAGNGAPALRSAPLQAAPREARMSTAARPAVLPKPLPTPVAPALPRATTVPAAEPAAIAVAESPATRPPAAPSSRPAEPPPWVDEAVPDEDAVGNAPGPPAIAVARPAPNLSADLHPTPEGERWAALVRPLLGQGGLTALVRELAVQAQLLGVDGQTWRLRVERETLRTSALRDKLVAVLEPVLGTGARIELEAGAVEDSIARREAAEREAAQREAEQVIRNDPAVGALMAQFRTARIVPGSIKPL